MYGLLEYEMTFHIISKCTKAIISNASYLVIEKVNSLRHYHKSQLKTQVFDLYKIISRDLVKNKISIFHFRY